MAAEEKSPENSLGVFDHTETKRFKSGETNEETIGRNNQPKANNEHCFSTGETLTHHKYKENYVGEWKLPEYNNELSNRKRPNKRPFNYSMTDGNLFPLKKAKGLYQVTKPLDFHGLQDLLNQEPSYIITSLANSKSRFNDLANNQPLRPDLLCLIIQVLSRVVESELHQLKIKVLSETMTPEMMDEINRYAQSICLEDDQHKLKFVESFFRDILKVFETCISCFPSSIMNEKFKSVLLALNLSMNNAKLVQGVSISDGIFDALKDVTEQVSTYVENSQRIDQEKSKNATFKDSKAPNSFRDMEIVPTKEDFMCQRAFLRKNIVQGSYRNCEEYLDVQFRLLREDFIDPLRTGIFEYLDSVHTPNFKQKISNVRIYPKVQFIGTSRDRLGFQINFDIEKKIPKNVNWEFNKRLNVGSLLLLTQNDFKQFFLATIIDRNIKQLYSSILTIAFVPGTKKPQDVFGPDVFFLMAESEVCYEAYRPVLSALQRMTEHTFPMKKYIVDVITDSIPPKHLRIESKYTVEHHEVDILDESSWPSPDELKLNPSQHQAFKSALTNEFAVIQGPPGTGKTFLALKITEVLLKNGVSKRTPIVVICYTNHALDQFLEGILKQTDRLIRIGSQSRNEALEKYNIGVVRKANRERRQLNLSDLYRSKVSEKCIMKHKLDCLKENVAEISIPNGILELRTLKSIIPAKHYDDLENQIVDWLFSEDHPGWFQKAAQASRYPEESLNPSSNPEAQKTEKPREDLDVEEEEENTRRLADLMEDDFLPAEDIKIETIYTSQVEYSFDLDKAYGVLNLLKDTLFKCQNSQINHHRLFYEEKNLKEQIQLVEWKINHLNFEAKKFRQFQFDGGKLAELQAVQSVWDIDPPLRWEYYWSWVHLYSCRLNKEIHVMANRYQDVMMELDEVRQLDDAAFVRRADVVGLTTSGAAKRRVLLENLGTEIVIVEEAAEVLEAHIVTALAPSVQHVILIGDHKQLKPNPAVYDLAKKFNLDISLFERMLNNEMGCSVLHCQHRMRPEIASLICPTIYPDLQNHPSTYDRAKISGIDKFVFFLNHNHPEDQLPDSTSRQNKFEADFLIELCQYLMRNGYQPQEITILATYFGQVWYMRQVTWFIFFYTYNSIEFGLGLLYGVYPGLRPRLDYLALCLRPRIEVISREDIVQIELEVTRIYRLLSESSNLDWYDVKPYTWEQDMISREPMELPPTSVLVNLKTRDFAKKWFECDRQHLYVSNVGDPCHVCEEDQEKLEQDVSEPLQTQQLGAQPNQAGNQGSNRNGHQVRNHSRNNLGVTYNWNNVMGGRHQGGNRNENHWRNQHKHYFREERNQGRNQNGNHGRNRDENYFRSERNQGRNQNENHSMNWDENDFRSERNQGRNRNENQSRNRDENYFRAERNQGRNQNENHSMNRDENDFRSERNQGRNRNENQWRNSNRKNFRGERNLGRYRIGHRFRNPFGN